MWLQANWEEPLIFEKGGKGRRGYIVPVDEEIRKEVGDPLVPEKLRRSKNAEIPELSEQEVVRHFTRLSQMSFGVDQGMVPLGSCTMKYNPKVEEIASSLAESLHPLQDEASVQGIMWVLYQMQDWLAEITGMDLCSLQVPAGSAGELAGVLMIRKYNAEKGRTKDEMLVADTAHGTNPASASMAGFKVIYIRSNNEGLVDLNALRSSLSDRTAGFVLTNPNTLGLFEANILEISKAMHEKDALLYYDGANLNGILGIARPGDMGFDVVHLNLHKTFAVPHGGGGPGAAAICAKGEIANYLPGPLVKLGKGQYRFESPPKSIGRISTFYGNVGNIVRSYAYILGLGSSGLKKVAELSTLGTNYLIAKLRGIQGLRLYPDNEKPRKHEVVYTGREMVKETGVTAEDVAKAILDRGFYAPTIYFPPVVEEAVMIEPPETEPKEVLDAFATALREISAKAYSDPEEIKKSPLRTARRRVDLAKANHPSTVTPTYRVKRLRESGNISALV